MPEQSLPDRPDLDQLRRQAKEFRDAVRAGNQKAIERLRKHTSAEPATVTLSIAQLVIAREHGFASWPALRQRVVEASTRASPRSPMADHLGRHGLNPSGFKRAAQINQLESGEIVVIEGHVIASAADRNDRSLVRLTIAQALGPPPGDQPDSRETMLICPADMILPTATHHETNGPPPGPGMHLPEASLVWDEALPASEITPGRIVMLDGRLIDVARDRADRSALRLDLVSGVRPPRGVPADRRKIAFACPADMVLPTVSRMAGWRVESTVVAEELEDDQAVVLKGRIIGSTTDSADAGRVHLTFVSSFGDPPDERELLLVVPRDMEFATVGD
jgi:hypothetical protein